jgi:hypothetical protein
MRRDPVDGRGDGAPVQERTRARLVRSDAAPEGRLIVPTMPTMPTIFILTSCVPTVGGEGNIYTKGCQGCQVGRVITGDREGGSSLPPSGVVDTRKGGAGGGA